MKSAQRKWVCKNCGRRNKTVAIAGGAMSCEYCTEVDRPGGIPAPDGGVSGGPATSARLVEDTRKRGVVARLRERYGDARELVSLGGPDPAQPYEHLEWVLGTHRDLDRDEAVFDTAPHASRSGEDTASGADSRRAIAQGLRTATRDFAEAFLSPRLAPVGEP